MRIRDAPWKQSNDVKQWRTCKTNTYISMEDSRYLGSNLIADENVKGRNMHGSVDLKPKREN